MGHNEGCYFRTSTVGPTTVCGTSLTAALQAQNLPLPVTAPPEVESDTDNDGDDLFLDGN